MIRRPWRAIGWALLAVTALGAGIGFQLLRPKHLRGEGTRPAPTALEARLRETIEALPAPRPIGSDALARAEAEVAARLRASGFGVERQPVEHGGVRSHNVIGRSESGKDVGPLWVIGAHLDTVPESPGADDNGSGVAVMLAVAERLAGTAAAAHVLFIAFADEERGLHGSTDWVRGLPEQQRRQLAGVFVLDTVGFSRSERGSQHYPPPLGALGPDTGDFTGCITLHQHRRLLELFVGARDRVAPALSLVTLATPRELADLVPDLWRSDHAPMWRAGIPALLLTDTGNFRNPHYHRASDLPETLDYATLAQLVETLAEVVRSGTPRFP